MAKNKLLYTLGFKSNSWTWIYNELKELYQSCFIWKDIPETVDERYIEKSLMQENQATFFREKEIDELVCIRSATTSKPDIYGNPIILRVWGDNGYSTEIDLREDKDAVVIYDNKTRVIPLLRLRNFAKRIDHIEKVMAINIDQQKTPRILQTDKDSELDVRRLMSQIDSFEEVVIVDKEMSQEYGHSVDVTLKPSPFVADKLRIEKDKIWSEALDFMGIENNSSEKKERLLEDEVKASQGRAYSKMKTRLNERQRAVDKINENFGLDIKVKFNGSSFKDSPLSDLYENGVELKEGENNDDLQHND